MYKGNCINVVRANDIDSLIVKGVRCIKKNGERFKATIGPGIQIYSMNYILNDSRQRIHNIRSPQSLRYLCRELLAYFNGSLNINDGLVQASSYWKIMADSTGRINSNYGYYIFYQKANGKTQYDWVISHLQKNKQSRQALININQNYHKDAKLRDFPCAIAMHFLVRDNYLCCEVLTRSNDIIYGLPYNLGFFSFINELVCADLNQSTNYNLKLGYTMLRCSFAQIYDETSDKAESILKKANNDIKKIEMPAIDNPSIVLEDIRNETQNSEIIKWIYKHAELK